MRPDRASVPQLVAGLTVTIIFLAVLSIVLTAAGPDGLGLPERRTETWIVAVYGLPMIPSLVLSLQHRQPLMLTGNVFALIFFLSLGDRVAFDELAGASMVAGAALLLTTLLGATEQLARWIPIPVVHGLIAGAVMPFVVDLFSSLNPSNGSAELSIVVASALLGYVLGLRFLRQLPAVLPAFLAGVVAAAVTGSLGALTPSLSLPDVQLLTPKFSWQAILTVAPVVLALLTLQANVPSVLYMRSQGFEPPERAVNVVSGVGTVVGSLLGPVAMSLALPATLVVAGPGAGERSSRYRSVAMPIAAGLLIALLAGTAAELAVILPPALLLAIAGLALVPALLAALRELSAGPLVLGPLFAFAIALSDLTFLGLGPFFWSLVLGTLTSFFLEREGWDQLASRTLRGTGPPR